MTKSSLEQGVDPSLGSVFGSLRLVRDNSPFSARNSSKGALIKEIYSVFQALSNGLPVEDLRQKILEGRLILHSSYETRRSIWNHINRRYFTFDSEWIVQSLAEASGEGMNSPSFLSLAYLYYVLRDRLTFEFVVGPLWDRWKKQTVTIDRADFLSFLGRESVDNSIIDRWFDSTKKKLASNTLSALRDFGLLKGVRRKKIQRPTIAPETAFHLLSILMAEGLRGQSIIDAPDWRMFLWSEVDIAHALNDMSFRRWTRFEKAGRTVILELNRLPRVGR
jgi:hypothetical protein